MIRTKLFSTSLQNDAFVAFLDKNPSMRGEEDDEALEAYINSWLEENPDAEIIEATHPVWAENHLFYFVFYKIK